MKRRNGEKGQGKKKKDMMFFTFPFSLIRFVFETFSKLMMGESLRVPVRALDLSIIFKDEKK